MANKTVAQPRNATGEGGYTGFSNVQEVDANIPEGWRPEIVYKDARGRFVDAYGNPVKGLGTNQKAGVAGTKEQKATTEFSPIPDNMTDEGALIPDDGEELDITQNENDEDEDENQQ